MNYKEIELKRTITAIMDEALLATENRTISAAARKITKSLTDRLLKPQRVFFESRIAYADVPYSGEVFTVGRSLAQAKITKAHYMRYENMDGKEREQEIIALIDGVLSALPLIHTSNVEKIDEARKTIYDRLTSFIPNYVGLHVATGSTDGDLHVRVHLTEAGERSTLYERTWNETLESLATKPEAQPVTKTEVDAMPDLSLGMSRTLIDGVDHIEIVDLVFADDKLTLKLYGVSVPDTLAPYFAAKEVTNTFFGATGDELFTLNFTVLRGELVGINAAPGALNRPLEITMRYDVHLVKYIAPENSK
ncbi:hypothetical protein EVC12_013 [Rhizobium phage RHph_I42]|nr:hypothetical protein EVC12_013 [Rhizobium phage RHph_I42]